MDDPTPFSVRLPTGRRNDEPLCLPGLLGPDLRLRAHPIPVQGNGTAAGSGAKIVLTCVGSLGDLFPYIALAGELQRRGHRPAVATVPVHRERVEAAGIAFHPIRAATFTDPTPELVRRVFDGRKGVEYIVRELILPSLRTAYEDTAAAAVGADLLVAHPLTFATRLVAETRDLPWISTQLAPCGVLSGEDPPLLPGLGWLYRLCPPAALWRALWRLSDRVTRTWLRPYDTLRVQLGLPNFGNPLFGAGHAPLRELALFSPRFAPPQTDWPEQTVATGFPFLEQPPVVDHALEAWLAEGPPPIVFTLGSSAVIDPGNFFRTGARAAERLRRRALLLGATPANGEPPAWRPVAGAQPSTPSLSGQGDVFVCRYAPYAGIFPRAAAIVHQGGIGTTSEALRAGRPMLVVPFGADQPDNAARAARLGVARVLTRRQYRVAGATDALKALLEEDSYQDHAESLGEAIARETGLQRACEVIEDVLAGSS